MGKGEIIVMTDGTIEIVAAGDPGVGGVRGGCLRLVESLGRIISERIRDISVPVRTALGKGSRRRTMAAVTAGRFKSGSGAVMHMALTAVFPFLMCAQSAARHSSELPVAALAIPCTVANHFTSPDGGNRFGPAVSR